MDGQAVLTALYYVIVNSINCISLKGGQNKLSVCSHYYYSTE